MWRIFILCTVTFASLIFERSGSGAPASGTTEGFGGQMIGLEPSPGSTVSVGQTITLTATLSDTRQGVAVQFLRAGQPMGDPVSTNSSGAATTTCSVLEPGVVNFKATAPTYQDSNPAAVTTVRVTISQAPSELCAKANGSFAATIEPNGRTITWNVTPDPAGVAATLDNAIGTTNKLWIAKTTANTAEGKATVKAYDTVIGTSGAVSVDVAVHEFRRGSVAAGNTTGGLSGGSDSIVTGAGWNYSDPDPKGADDASRVNYANSYAAHSSGDQAVGEVKLVRTVAGSIGASATTTNGWVDDIMSTVHAKCGVHLASAHPTLNAQIDKTAFATAGYGNAESISLGVTEKNGVTGAYTFTRTGNQPTDSQTYSVSSQRKYSYSAVGTNYELEATADVWTGYALSVHIGWYSGGAIQLGNHTWCTASWTVTDTTGSPSLTPAPFAQEPGHDMVIKAGPDAN